MARVRKDINRKRSPKGLGSIRPKEIKRKDGTWYIGYELRYTLGKDENGLEHRRSITFRTEAEAKEKQLEIATTLQKAKNNNWSFSEREVALLQEPPTLQSTEKESGVMSPAAATVNPPTEATAKTVLTVDEWFDKWLSIYFRGAESTRRKYRGDYNRYIHRVIGDMPLSDVRSLNIQEMVNKWQDPDYAIKKPLSNKYTKDIHAMLKSCFKKALENEYIRSNPCVGTILKKDTKAEKESKKLKISWEQLTQVVNAISHAPHARFYLFSAFFGLRVMENLGLTMQDIDMAEKVIHLKYQRRRNFDEKPRKEYGETKHFKILKDKDARDIYFDDEVAKILQAQIDYEKFKKKRLGNKWPTNELERGDLLFSNDEGSYPSYSTIRDCFYRRVHKIIPDITIHDLRHIYVMIAFVSGVPMEIIAQHVGHEDARLTRDVYLSIPVEQCRQSATAVGSTIAQLRKDSVSAVGSIIGKTA